MVEVILKKAPKVKVGPGAPSEPMLENIVQTICNMFGVKPKHHIHLMVKLPSYGM